MKSDGKSARETATPLACRANRHVLNPPDPETQRLARAAMQAFTNGDRTAAKDLARQLLLRRASDPNAHQILGVIALDAGDVAAARRHLEAANAAAPNQGPIVN